MVPGRDTLVVGGGGGVGGGGVVITGNIRFRPRDVTRRFEVQPRHVR